MDASRCVDDPEVFVVEMYGDAVVNVDTDPSGVATLAAGEWFGVFPDPLGGCEIVMLSFHVDEVVP